MRETITTSSVLLEVVNPETGNKFVAEGSSKEVSKYYKINRITSRVNSMDLLNVLAKVCKSPKDLNTMNVLLDESNGDGRIVITNISTRAVELNVARSKLNSILSSAVKENFLFKIDKGVYMINPYIFIGKKVRSNELREALQKEWAAFTDNMKYLR
jgi:hypothetical protein